MWGHSVPDQLSYNSMLKSLCCSFIVLGFCTLHLLRKQKNSGSYFIDRACLVQGSRATTRKQLSFIFVLVFWLYLIPVQFVERIAVIRIFLQWEDVGRWDGVWRVFLSDVSKSLFPYFNLVSYIFITLSVGLYIFIYHLSSYQYRVNTSLFIKHKNASIFWNHVFLNFVVSLGIFSRPKVYVPSSERWSLQIQQTTLNFSFFGVGRFFSTNYTYHPPSADPMPVCGIINDISQKGGRLLCMECTGTVFSTGMSFSRAGGKLSSWFNKTSRKNFKHSEEQEYVKIESWLLLIVYTTN